MKWFHKVQIGPKSYNAEKFLMACFLMVAGTGEDVSFCQETAGNIEPTSPFSETIWGGMVDEKSSSRAQAEPQVLLDTAVDSIPLLSSGEWVRRLEQGYADESPGPLREVIGFWLEATPHVDKERLSKKPTFEQAVYGWFSELFCAQHVGYAENRFFIVQSEIELRIADSDLAAVWQKGKECAEGEGKWFDAESTLRHFPLVSDIILKEFRPQVSKESLKVLYLAPVWREVLLRFLSGEEPASITPDHGKRMEEGRERMAYLNQCLQIREEHWGQGWEFESSPYVYCSYMSRDMKRAIILFKEGYGGRIAYMSQTGGKWQLDFGYRTWVQ